MSVQVNFAHQKHNWIHATARYQHNTGMWDTQQIICPVSAGHFIQQCFWWHTVYMYHDMYMHARKTYTALVETLNHGQSINVHAQQGSQWCLAAAHTFSASSRCR